MLKTAAPPERSTSEEVGDDEGGDGVDGDGGGGVEITKKSGKSKGEKSAKSRKSSKSGKSKGEKSKKPPKSGNSPNFGATASGPSFLTPEARSAFNRLRLAFTKAPILRHFDPEGYAIGSVLSQLVSGTSPDGIVTKTDFGQWHPVAFFLRKMILVQIQYKTHDSELLAIVKAFKTWYHYLKNCKHEVFVLTDHNNFCCFIDTKNLSSRQVCWAQKLSQYYFRIDYHQGKANAATDTISRFPQKNQNEEDELQTENS